MPSTRIEIIGVGDSAVFSIGGIVVQPKGDVIVFNKSHPGHRTRHASGVFHFKRGNGETKPIRQGPPLKNFKGLEFLGTHIYSVENLPRLYTEYKMKKCDGIFAIDLRAYKEASLNMVFAILSREGLSELAELWKPLGKKQLYIYESSHPMIAIKVWLFPDPLSPTIPRHSPGSM